MPAESTDRTDLKPDYEEQARAFVDGLADGVLRQPLDAGAKS